MTKTSKIIWLLATLGALALSATKCRGEVINAERLADAIYRAEGGAKAKKPYGILSIPVRDEAHARRICLNTIRNNVKRWEKAGKPGDYLEFLARRYAPVGAANDPTGLNKNWLKNVRFFYKQPNVKLCEGSGK
jgi:predicted amidophosphoribosyltransferase